jgi:hypothetical protein
MSAFINRFILRIVKLHHRIRGTDPLDFIYTYEEYLYKLGMIDTEMYPIMCLCGSKDLSDIEHNHMVYTGHGDHEVNTEIITKCSKCGRELSKVMFMDSVYYNQISKGFYL